MSRLNDTKAISSKPLRNRVEGELCKPNSEQYECSPNAGAALTQANSEHHSLLAELVWDDEENAWVRPKPKENKVGAGSEKLKGALQELYKE